VIEDNTARLITATTESNDGKTVYTSATFKIDSIINEMIKFL